MDAWCTGTAGAKTCQLLPAKGAACATDLDQTHPFGCALPAVCNGATCGDRLPSGAACTNTGIFNTCADGLTCGQNGTCVAIPGEGQACTGACQPGLTCTFSGSGGICKKPACGT